LSGFTPVKYNKKADLQVGFFNQAELP